MSTPKPETTTNSATPPNSRAQHLKNAAITVIALTLAFCWVFLGPRGDFVSGRAFSVTTLEEITYVFYNWTVDFPVSSGEFKMQAWNTRLEGITTLAAAPRGSSRVRVAIETTAPPSLFSITQLNDEDGFSIKINDRLPNKYGIDYARIVVYFPATHYDNVTWITYPRNEFTNEIKSRKWDIHLDDLEHARVHFGSITVLTDQGNIHSDGVEADRGTFLSNGGTVTGNYMIPQEELTTTEISL